MTEQDNGRLLVQLVKEVKANDVGDINGFFRTPANWFCPGCLRPKSAIARRHKDGRFNGALCCIIHEHHDHFGDMCQRELRVPRASRENIQENRNDFAKQQAIRDSFTRFAPTLMCADCNAADTVAKQMVGAYPDFSFSPCEIPEFIGASPGQMHQVYERKAKDVYEAILPSLRILYKRFLRTKQEYQNKLEDSQPNQA